MEKNITDTLKEATKDILTEDVLKDIETAFNASVNDKVKIHVEKALLEQDEDYSKKLETLVEAIDTDHTNKLNTVMQAVETDRADKLKAVINKYETAIVKEANVFRETLVESISKYLEKYLDEKLPYADIQSAVKNKRAIGMLESIRETLSVDMALSQESIKNAVIDGKNKIIEAATQLEASEQRANKLAKELNKVKSELALEKSIQDLDADKKVYMKKMLSGKSADFITENSKYTLGLYEKTEEDRLEGLKEEAVKEAFSSKVDRPVVTESVASQDVEAEPGFSNYMSELSKY